MKIKKKPLAHKLMKKKPPKGKPGRPAKPWPEKIDDTPENIARVLMGGVPDWMETAKVLPKEEELEE